MRFPGKQRLVGKVSLLAFLAVCLLGGYGSAPFAPYRLAHATRTAISHALPAAAGSISCQPRPAGAAGDDYLACAYAGPHKTSMAFYLYIPHGYDPRQRYPLALVLHGGGERAQASLSVTTNSAAVLDQNYVAVWGPGSPAGGPSVQTRWPSFVVAPQAESPDRWVNVPAAQGAYAILSKPSASLSMAMAIVELVQQEYTAIDPNRRYITGISMGGYGVWDAVERWPGYFAAAVPVAGAGSPALAGELVGLPVWDFHGAGDKIVPVSGSREMIEAMQAAGGHPCYTEYAGEDHPVWGQVYDLAGNPDNPLYPWLFAQQRGSPPSTTATCVTASSSATSPTGR